METTKVTIFGDIMCEAPLLKAALRHGSEYDFSSVFMNIKDMIAEADYVIGNLETPFAGESAVYTDQLYAFNTPDALVDAVKAAGIDLVATANNHCLDRGYDGFMRTMAVLEEKGLAYTGTWPSAKSRKEAYYAKVKDTVIAVINYTYGTNYAVNKNGLTMEQEPQINLLRPQRDSIYMPKPPVKRTLKRRLWGRFLSMFSQTQQILLLKALGRPYNEARADDCFDAKAVEPYIARMQADIREARKNADVVLFNPHVGGQFNLQPGKFTEYVIEKALEAGCDAIVASHPHIVQQAEYRADVPCFYSIGNFSMSPTSVYLLHENLPEYGLAVHLYLEDKKVKKTTFSIVKMVEGKREPLTVRWIEPEYVSSLPVKEQAKVKKEAEQICRIVQQTNEQPFEIRKEYPLQTCK